jgi:hypothetical protein
MLRGYAADPCIRGCREVDGFGRTIVSRKEVESRGAQAEVSIQPSRSRLNGVDTTYKVREGSVSTRGKYNKPSNEYHIARSPLEVRAATKSHITHVRRLKKNLGA